MYFVSENAKTIPVNLIHLKEKWADIKYQDNS